MYWATASSALSRRAMARGPAPTISTSRVCASSGKSRSALRNALVVARIRFGGSASRLASPAARMPPMMTSIAASNSATMQSSLLSKCS